MISYRRRVLQSLSIRDKDQRTSALNIIAKSVQEEVLRKHCDPHYLLEASSIQLLSGNFDLCRNFAQQVLDRSAQIDSSDEAQARRIIDDANLREKIEQCRDKQRVIGCDVICIASDEAPYIAEFVHHYIYLGFRNIYIGINRITDSTLLILDRIKLYYPQVIIVDVDDVLVHRKQWGAYGYILQQALDQSDSSHVLIVDVDEYWVSGRLQSGKVNVFLEANPYFDLRTFFWCTAKEAKPFETLVGNPNVFELNQNMKSMFRYTLPLNRIRIHTPVLGRHPYASNYFIGSERVNRLPSRQLGWYPPEKNSIHAIRDFEISKTNAFIIHRRDRSVQEYAYRLFKTHANQEDHAYFKKNRIGFNAGKSLARVPEKRLGLISSRLSNKDYLSSYKSFIELCNIGQAIAESRLLICEESIVQKCLKVPIHALIAERDIWNQSFRDTPYLQVLEARLCESRCH